MAKSQKQLLAEMAAYLGTPVGSLESHRPVRGEHKPVRRNPGTKSINRKHYCERCDAYYTDKQAFFHAHK